MLHLAMFVVAIVHVIMIAECKRFGWHSTTTSPTITSDSYNIIVQYTSSDRINLLLI